MSLLLRRPWDRTLGSIISTLLTHAHTLFLFQSPRHLASNSANTYIEWRWRRALESVANWVSKLFVPLFAIGPSYVCATATDHTRAQESRGGHHHLAVRSTRNPTSNDFEKRREKTAETRAALVDAVVITRRKMCATVLLYKPVPRTHTHTHTRLRLLKPKKKK
jgi:hypothetical protein